MTIISTVCRQPAVPKPPATTTLCSVPTHLFLRIAVRRRKKILLKNQCVYGVTRVMPVPRKTKPGRTGRTASKSTTSPRVGAAVMSSAGAGAMVDCQKSRPRNVKCALCNQGIVDGKDQALFCEGSCQGWFHRDCAGVSLIHFETLSSSSQPFHFVLNYFAMLKWWYSKNLFAVSRRR